MEENPEEHEALVKALNDPELRAAYAAPYDHYKAGLVPNILGWILVTMGNTFYGHKPSYAKFKAVEVIARIPYQSWEAATYTLLTAFYSNEKYAIKLCNMSAFSRFAQDNETMHVVVISSIVRKIKKGQGFFRHTLVPLLFSFFYYWVVYLVYVFSHKAALELNYLFESHAYSQYSKFLELEGDKLKQRPVNSEFLEFYGRHCLSEYELFESIRNDELIHRNRSIREIAVCTR
jgi:hypothetical protein